MYGVFSIVYSLDHEKDIPVLAIVFTAIGATMLVAFAILYLINVLQKRKRRNNNPTTEVEEEIEEFEPEVEEETQIEENIKEAEPIEEPQELASNEDNDFEEVTYEKVRTTSSFSGGSVYIKRVGYGPVLRVSGAEILDMRNNSYYHIEGNMVKKDGSGPVFEINGNRIKAAFGSYLYEISGNNVNKIYGGFYASINDSSIQIHDLSERYEISGSLNLSQKLAVIALLFGAY